MKRPLSRSERASKYAEQCPTVKRMDVFDSCVMLKRELKTELQNAYMAGWNDKTKLERKVRAK